MMSHKTQSGKPLAAVALLLFAGSTLPIETQAAPVLCSQTDMDVKGFSQGVGEGDLWFFERPYHSDPSEMFFVGAGTGYKDGCLYAEAQVAVGAGEVNVGQQDSGGDGMGDDWAQNWEEQAGQVIEALMDLDGDGLDNIDEFRWELVPVCVADFGNCMDYEGDVLTGAGGDNWLDGDEVAYWNDAGNDAQLFEIGNAAATAFFDPDRTLDTDGDGQWNIHETDSDGDGLLDGDEFHVYGSYPEFRDSDCSLLATACTASGETSYHDPERTGSPGTGDGLGDAQELAYWSTVSASAWEVDYDGDGIASNLLDADADGDTLLDGEEVLVWGTKPHAVDSDRDGLRDDEEVRVHQTDPNDWDTDGDGLPDGWEVEHHFQPLVDDASGDADIDGLENLGEYAYGRPGTWSEPGDGPWDGGTNPNDADTEGDGLMDGPEVLTHSTDPFWWDSDGDGMPDSWEVRHGFAPLSDDAASDADSDFFDQGSDGVVEQEWPNVQEYEYKRPASWDETQTGPWSGGTDPTDPDTDGDGAIDGQEAYFGTDATVGADPNADDDQDGLNWTEEANLGTNPSDPDTDGDGLCDGGRAAACTWPGGDGTGFQPGEADYGSTPWMTDSDDDGLDDDDEAILWDPGATGVARDPDSDFLNGVIDADNDGDGLEDGDEVGRSTNPAVADTDADGISDGGEVSIYDTNPLDSDTDSDGLGDGAELNTHHTRPTVADTDGDGLGDGAEIQSHGTDPLARDTDGDGVPDGWEVTKGTLPRVDDADMDPDADGLANGYEYSIGSHPMSEDTDGDGLPDGWEDRHATSVLIWSSSLNPDADGATNIQEYTAGTDPNDPDTDGDGLLDGDELDEGSDPLAQDSDLDGLLDGPEVHEHGSSPVAYDTDGDGLSDFDEADAGTDPRDVDTDGDGLSDHEEVMVYKGFFPTEYDSDGDGLSDGEEVALSDPQGDFDNDGLNNGQESSYGTDPTKADSDCDGIEDGPEVSYWRGRYALSTYKAYLLDPDVDGDGIKDGVEIGQAGTSTQVIYRTRPDRADTDGEGLLDGEEARNNFEPPNCQQQMSASALPGMDLESLLFPGSAPALPLSVGPASLVDAATDLVDLAAGSLYEDPSGLLFGVDWQGLYVQGGYQVRLYVNLSAVPDLDPSMDLSDLLGPQAMGGPGTNGEFTDPLKRDTDGDGLTDYEEMQGSKNPYKDDKSNSMLPGGNTDPTRPDSDGDGILDGPEVGVKTDGDALVNAWVTNPNRFDTDGDGKNDDVESGAKHGQKTLSYDATTGVYSPSSGAMSSPVDADTDDDGVSDDEELLRGLNPLDWDFDHDGLSDGLELGKTDRVQIAGSYTNDLGVPHTKTTQQVFGLSGWYTFQPFPTPSESPASYDNIGAALTTSARSPDTDGDGLLDGLEDWNHNGIRGDDACYKASCTASELLEELDPGNPDTDGDDLGDGRELLVFIRSEGQTPKVTFGELFNSKGFTVSQLVYDSGNVWETDPRVPDSDGDGVVDGLDMNPRRDTNFVSLRLDGFEFLDVDIDNGGPDAREFIEMFASPLTVDLPFMSSQYVINMNSGAHVPVKIKECNWTWYGSIECPTRYGYRELPDALIEKISNHDNLKVEPRLSDFGASFTGTVWRVQRILNEPIIRFQLPEGIDNVNPTDMKVTIKVQLNDEDFNTANALDLNPDASKKYGEITIDLLGDTAGTFSTEAFGTETFDYFDLDQFANVMIGTMTRSKGSEDARLGVEVGDTIPSHFANALKITKIGGVAHLNKESGAGGKDYFGNQGDLGP